MFANNLNIWHFPYRSQLTRINSWYSTTIILKKKYCPDRRETEPPQKYQSRIVYLLRNGAPTTAIGVLHNSPRDAVAIDPRVEKEAAILGARNGVDQMRRDPREPRLRLLRDSQKAPPSLRGIAGQDSEEGDDEEEPIDQRGIRVSGWVWRGRRRQSSAF